MNRLLVLSIGLVLCIITPTLAVPGLPLATAVRSLKDEDRTVRLQAAGDLGDLGAAAREAVPALVAAWKTEQDRDVRARLARALTQIGPAAVPDLARALKDEDLMIRYQAARSLGRIGPDAAPAAGALADAFKENALDTRAKIAWALGEIGPAARDAAPVLLRGLADDEKVRTQSVNALVKIGTDSVPVLCRGLGDSRPTVRYWSAHALALFGPKAADAVAPLTRTLKGDGDPKVRGMAAAALAEIGPQAAPAVPALLEALKSKDKDLVGKAAYALAQIGPAARPGLVALLKDREPTHRSAALSVLGWMGADAAPTVPDLVAALADRQPAVRSLAILALGQIGPKAAAASPDLTGLLTDADPNIRVAAALALAQVQPGDRQAVARLNRMIETLPYSAGPTRGMAAQLDRRRQADIERFLEFFVWITSFNFGDGLKPAAKLATIRLGPEAIPAIVHTLNKLHADPTGKEPVPGVANAADQGKDLPGTRTFYFI